MRNKQNEWVFRLNEEMKVSPYTYFITLTYRDDDLPFACYVPEKRCFPCVSRRDIQLFLKRLRKKTKVKFKYHIVSEYGPETLRPHYHGLLFCQNFIDSADILVSWNHQDLVNNCVEFANSRSAIGYVTKYLCKTPFLPSFLRYSERDYKPFTLCSKGLGLTYLETNPQLVNKIIKQSEDFVILDGRKQVMPRYYRDKIYTDEDTHTAMVERKQKLSDEVNQRMYESWCKKHNYTPSFWYIDTRYKDYQSAIRKDQWRKAYKNSKYNKNKEKL